MKQRVAIDRWGTLNAVTHEVLAKWTKETRSGSAGLVWFVLFSLADGRDGLVRGPVISKLARLTGIDRKTVREAVKFLEEKKAVKRTKDGDLIIQHRLKEAKKPNG